MFDAGYDLIALTDALSTVRANIVVRIRGERVFYTDPTAAAPGSVGRPRRHGTGFGLADATDERPQPDEGPDHLRSGYGKVLVQAWHNLHPKLGRRGHWASHDTRPIVRGTVIRVQVEHLPKPTGRAPEDAVAVGRRLHRR